MSIRKEALQNEAFQQLKERYDDRTISAKEWKKEGKKVVGTLGADVPDELLVAADLLAYPIFGEPGQELAETDQYLEFSFPLPVRAQFEKILSGADGDLLDYLVIANSTDAFVRIYYYIRELKQLEPERQIPPLYFIDWLFTKARMHQIRNESVLEQFRQTLSQWSERKITNESIKNAAAICNRNRAALEEMGQLRRKGRILGSEALVIIGAGLYMPKEKHTKLVRELLKDAQHWPKADSAAIFVTGSVQEHGYLYENIERWGGNVVSEDHDFGDRSWNKQTNIDLSPIKGIVDRYMLRITGTKRAFVSERTESVCRNAQQCGAKGVISYTFQYDDAPSWDFPKQAKALAAKGIQSLQLWQQPYEVESDHKSEQVLKQFLEQIREA